MSKDELRDRLDELRGALTDVERHLENESERPEALHDFRKIVDGTRRSVWNVLEAANRRDYDGFVAGFRLRRAADLYRAVLQHLHAGHITVETDEVDTLRDALEQVTETFDEPPQKRAAVPGPATAGPAPADPRLHEDVQHLRQSLDLIEEQMSAESIPDRAYEDFKVAIDNVRTSVLAMLFATRSKDYSVTIGQFHLNRAVAITTPVLSDLVLGTVDAGSEDYADFKAVALEAFDRIDLLCGGGLRRLGTQQPARLAPAPHF
jgi:hypothetical protein